MDELVVKHYRRLCKTGFEHAGSLENPSVFLDTVGENTRICAHVSHSYIHIYINISNGIVDDIRYLCTCDPTANVVLEILCDLVKGKSLQEAKALTEESFSRALGSKGEEFLKKSRAVIEFLNKGLARYESGPSP